MFTSNSKTLLCAICLLAASQANATLLEITGGSAGDIPGVTGTNEGVGPVYGTTSRDGYYGSTVSLTQDVTALKFEFLGFEAGFENEFNYSGTELFDTESLDSGFDGFDIEFGNPLDSAVYLNVLAGVLDFSFDYDSDAGTISNTGANPDDALGTAGAANFFVSCESAALDRTCDSLIVWLDDNGAGDDDNHDDFVVRITASVPEPSVIAMLGFGLVGFSMMQRKKS